jgi:hypothetical protein
VIKEGRYYLTEGCTNQYSFALNIFNYIILENINKLDNQECRERLVKTYLPSEDYENYVIPRICLELDFNNAHISNGIQFNIKNEKLAFHFISFLLLIAEDERYLNFVSNEKAKKLLQSIAGRYKVIRFEITGQNSLQDMVTYQIDNYLEQWGVDYSIYEDRRPFPYSNMMAAFEEAFPNKGLMIVIDDLLTNSHNHSPRHLSTNDFIFLQELGRMSCNSKFRMVIGVRDKIYHAPDFQFEVQMLDKLSHLYIWLFC